MGITLHYTASPVGYGKEAVEAIARYQVTQTDRDPFPAIAYSFVIDGFGDLYRCHDLSTRCWHSGAVVDGVARNASHVGIAFIGDGSPSQVQVWGLGVAIDLIEAEIGRDLALEGHRDAPYATLCPGPGWPDWREGL